AGVPTIVYGFFALTFVTPMLQQLIPSLKVFNALSPGIVVGIMILPMIHHDLDDSSLVVEFTKRMKMYFQDSTMARINENEFVVITPLPEWFTQGFLTYLQQNPIYNGNVAVPLSISGGMTRYPEDQTTFSQLMKASLATIATVREAGGDRIVSLSKSSHAAINRKSIVERRLLQALDQKNLHVLYQPQLDIQSGTVTAVEALVRWDDEEIGVVSPDELIPIAEETGLINNIGSFMLERACEQATAWKKAGHNIKVSINSSVREFRDKNMAKSILDTLERTGCPANLLQIEITEKFALEAEAENSIIKQMRTLENEGIIFALDDFGTGYGSFRYMQLLPISIVKIDQTFTSALKSEKTQLLVNGMVQLGKSMNLRVVAEGVETEEQQQLLTSFGCDAVQGFYISKPVTSSEISNLI
ncbi:MAG TPA: EAL domain-containing protein, partial [Solibacillus sp.]